jgi:glucose-1-phosphate adenylyltransferase
MGADFYNQFEITDDDSYTEYSVKIGEGTFIRKAIIDKNVSIGKNVRIDPGDRVNEDNEWCHIRDGIIVIPKGSTIPDGTVV